jgi:hypothetical protein
MFMTRMRTHRSLIEPLTEHEAAASCLGHRALSRLTRLL